MANEFKPTDAATSAFSFMKTHPKFCFKFVGFYIAPLIIFLAGFVFVIHSLYEKLHLLGPEELDKSAFLNALPFFAIPFGIVLFVAIFAISISTIAMGIRKAVLNQEIGFHGLAWGSFETRLATIYVSATLLIFALFIPFFIMIASMAQSSNPDDIGAAFAVLGFVFLLFIVIIPFEFYAIGRWGLFGVFALLNDNYGFKDSANFSKGKFWNIFFSYVLTYLIWMVIIGVAERVGILFLNFDPNVFEAISSADDFKNIFNFGFVLRLIIFMILILGLSALNYLAFICTGVFIYKKITQDNAEQAQI